MERPVKHSPAPWAAAWDDREGDETTFPGVPVVDKRGKVVVFVHHMEKDREDADAALIAASPEMLALLRDMEFSATTNFGHVMVCPFCLTDEDSPHKPDCRLGALLQRIDERRGSDPMR